MFLIGLLYFFSEIYFSLFLIDHYSFWEFFLYSLSSALLGLALMSILGRGVLISLQRDLTQGKMPAHNLLNKGLLFFGAFLIFLPGILNDVFAFLLIVPGPRHVLAWWFTRHLSQKIKTGSHFTFVHFGSAGMGGGAQGPQFRTERDAEVVEIEPIEIEHSNRKNN